VEQLDIIEKEGKETKENESRKESSKKEMHRITEK